MRKAERDSPVLRLFILTTYPEALRMAKLEETKQTEVKGFLGKLKKAEEKREEVKEEVKPVEVEVTRDFISVFPKIREEHRQVLVTYTYKDWPPATVTVDLFDLFKEKQKEAEEQILKREGDLYKAYLEVEAKTIRQDIKRREAIIPEVIKI